MNNTLPKLAFLIAIALSVALCGPSSAGELHDAVRAGDFEAVRRIVASATPQQLSAPLARGVTALHMAAAAGRTDLVVLLVKGGANVNARTDNGFAPLHWAAARDQAAVVRYLAVSGANMNATTEQGITPMHWAASKNATNAVQVLLSLGANINLPTTRGLRPLHWAVRQNADEASLLLAVSETLQEGERPSAAVEEEPPPAQPVAPAGAKPALLWKPFKIPMGHSSTMEFVWVEALRLWVGKHEVTNREFRRFAQRHDSGSHEEHSLNDDDQPAVLVDWTAAQSYCRWLNTTFHNVLPRGWVFRLPTEREWEAFARCGDRRTYPWGNDLPPKYGNYSDNMARNILAKWRGLEDYDDGFAVTCPVEKSGENEWGLLGVGGNVWEWCADWYDDAHTYRVRKGGSWIFDNEVSLRVAYRGFDMPTARFDSIGFRVVAGRTPAATIQRDGEAPPVNEPMDKSP